MENPQPQPADVSPAIPSKWDEVYETLERTHINKIDAVFPHAKANDPRIAQLRQVVCEAMRAAAGFEIAVLVDAMERSIDGFEPLRLAIRHDIEAYKRAVAQ